MEINKEELKSIIKDIIKSEILDNLKIDHTVHSEDGFYYGSIIRLFYGDTEIIESKD